MSKLDEISPELHRHFMNGGFSVQMGEANKFGRVTVDQTLEETIKRYTNCWWDKGFQPETRDSFSVLSHSRVQSRGIATTP